MRKFFMLVAIVGLALLVASPAPALDFKFGSEYRVRFYAMANQDFTDAAGSNPRGVQSRIRPRFDVSDDNGNMTATLRLEIGDIEWGANGGASGVTNAGAQGNLPGATSRVANGAGGRVGTDGVNVETKWAYVDFASPLGVPLRWRAGLQPWYLPKGIIVDDDATGLRAYGKASIVSYEAAWWRASRVLSAGNPTAVAVNDQDNSLDYWQARADFAVAPWLNPGLYYIYGRNAADSLSNVSAATTTSPSDQHFFGVTVTGDVKFLKYDLDFLFGSQEGGNSGGFNAGQKVRGWMVDGGVHVPVGPVLIHAVGSYATGDKQDGGKSEAMPWISPSWNGAGGLYELVGAGGTFDATETSQDYPAGLWMIGTGAEYRPVKALWLRAMYGFIGFTRNSANCAFNKAATAAGSACYGPSYTGKDFVTTAAAAGQGVGGLAGKSTLGHEISFRADYDLWTNFKIQAAAGWLIPNDGETVGEYVLQLY